VNRKIINNMTKSKHDRRVDEDLRCGSCTLCCKLLSIPDTNSNYGEYCSNCSPNIGCTIHSGKPKKCEIFQCTWYQMEKVHPDLRPDVCGVIFEKINDKLILGTTDMTLKDISPLINGQIKSFVIEGFSVMMQQFHPHKWTCLLTKDANREEIIKALEDKANDSAIIY